MQLALSHGRARTVRLLGSVHDLACAVIAPPLAFVLRTGALPEPNLAYWVFHGVFIVSVMVVSVAAGLNQGSWRYASIEDLIGIVQVAFVSVFLAVLASFAVDRLELIPRTAPVLVVGAQIMLMAGPRLLYRVLKDRYLQRMFGGAKGGERVLLVGYSDEASFFLSDTARQKSSPYQAVGIIDPSGRHVGRKLHGARVLGTLDELAEIVRTLRLSDAAPTKLVVAPSKTDAQTMAQIVDIASELSMQVFSLPHPSSLIESAAGAPALKPRLIRIDDLLGRPQAPIDLGPVRAMLKGQTTLVTGGGGSIGSELVRQILMAKPSRLVILDQCEFNLYQVEMKARLEAPDADIVPLIGDVRDRAAIMALFEAERPSFVFHAAALKHVPIVERTPLEGAHTNILGTVNVADAAVAAGASAFVMISTDKAVNPTNVMGATKRFAEAYCTMLDSRAECATRFMTVRFGNVLGSAGSVVPLFQKQIDAGGPVTVSHPEMQRYFMTMGEAVSLVLAASARGLVSQHDRGKIMVLNMGTQIRIVDLATRMIQLAGLRPGVDVEIHFTGLRPGEKLYEERLSPAERIEPTSEDWLDMAEPRQTEPATLSAAMQAVTQAVDKRDVVGLMAAIRAVVPELTPDHRAIATLMAESGASAADTGHPAHADRSVEAAGAISLAAERGRRLK
jgi:O-antigen biosynthesis protein WbqV